MADLTARLEELQGKYKEILLSHAQLESNKTSLIFQIDKLQDRMDEQHEDLAELRSEIRRKTTTVLDHERTIDKLREAKFELETHVAQLKEKMEAGNAALEEVDELREKLALKTTLEARAAAANDEVRDLKRKNGRLGWLETLVVGGRCALLLLEMGYDGVDGQIGLDKCI